MVLGQLFIPGGAQPGWAGWCLLQRLLPCCSPGAPAGEPVFIAVDLREQLRMREAFQQLLWAALASLPQPTFLPVQAWNSTAGRESGWIPNELFLASTRFPSLLMIWKMQTMLWKASSASWAGSVHFPSFISYNNSPESLSYKSTMAIDLIAAYAEERSLY